MIATEPELRLQRVADGPLQVAGAHAGGPLRERPSGHRGHGLLKLPGHRRERPPDRRVHLGRAHLDPDATPS